MELPRKECVAHELRFSDTSMDEVSDGSDKDSDREKRGVYVRRSQIVAAVILVLMVAAVVGLLVGYLPECETTTETTKPRPTVTTPAPTPPCLDPWCNLRLPSAIYPEHYKLLLYPDLDTGNFTGAVDIDIVVEEAIKFPRLHINKMIIHSSQIRPAVESGSTPAPALEVVRSFEYVPNQFYVMEMKDDLMPGNYVWSLEFQGYLQPQRTGFYLSTYTNEKGENRKMATSKFEPTDARRAFPCFDEPNLKANFTTSLVRPQTPYIALSNMNEVSSTPYLSTNMIKTDFAPSVKMSTYLACFIVCDFEFKESFLKSGIPFRVYAPPHQIDQVDYALELGVNVTDYYEDYYDLAYPLPKLDMIAIPDFTSGAMEHWGLITYREVYLLYSETESSVSNKQRIAEVVAHELAHQWFGNIVTMDWWDDLWLNEGFASYVEYIGVDYCHPDWQKMYQFLNQDFFYVMGNDQIVSSHPIIVDLQNPDQINEVFDSIPYSKGASVLRMLDSIVGTEAFKTGVATYLKKYEYQNAVSDDLWREITIASQQRGNDINVKHIMDSWTLQMGFPVVTLTKTDTGSGLVFNARQEWFLIDPNADKSQDLYGSPFNYTWYVPLDFYFETDPVTVVSVHMNYSGVAFNRASSDNDKWYVANYGEYGFYRVNYDPNNWKLLSNQLVANHSLIDIRDRAGLLDDAFNLARAELINYEIPLDMTKYLINELEFTPWDAAYDSIIWLREMLRYRPLFANLRKYFAAQAKPMLDKLTWNDQGTHMEKKLRSDIIYMSCGFGDSDCLEQAVLRFTNYLNGQSVPVNIRRQVYRFGMEETGDQDAWDYLWEMYMNSTVSTEKTNLRYAMARTRQVWLLSRYLEYCRDESKIRSQDFFTTLGYIADNPVGNSLVWDWVRANYDYLLERFGASDRYLGRLVPGFVDYWNTEQKLKELEDFWAEYPDAGAGARGRLQAIERIKTNIKWMEKNEATIAQWLNDNL
ncbi:glutamyl aminopeptidase-like isoform X2 [Acanthaster planci]|uniref:Aminopeptidase n=1 Tax=Acanthaster planci TaxID=133434 RepID=A0A8B7XGE8_ACAPL|nr:glutamyl aminopeptidase-like isoform X2 [Acanthaster planci]